MCVENELKIVRLSVVKGLLRASFNELSKVTQATMHPTQLHIVQAMDAIDAQIKVAIAEEKNA